MIKHSFAKRMHLEILEETKKLNLEGMITLAKAMEWHPDKESILKNIKEWGEFSLFLKKRIDKLSR